MRLEPPRPGNGDPSELRAARAAVLERVKTTYRAYRTTGYSERWETRAQGAALSRQEYEDWLCAAFSSARHELVVDIGCGNGNLASILDDHGARPGRYIGVDILEERLAAARERVPWGEFILASGDDMPFAATAADAVAAITVFSSLPEPWFRRRVAAEIARILKPGGIAVVYDIRYRSTNRAVAPISSRLLRSLFPGWAMDVRTMTLLPPLARGPLGGGRRRYTLLSLCPLLRSHLGVVLTRPR